MQFSKYRYRPVHAICEALIGLAAPIISSSIRPLSTTNLNILVIKFGGMGEAVLARSLLERLRERNPGMSFDFLVEDRTEEMMTLGSEGIVFRYTPGKDGISRALKILRNIRRRKYDAILDFEQHSLLTAAFARASSIPFRVGFVQPIRDSRAGMFTHPVELTEGKSMWNAFIKIGQILDPSLPDSLMTVPVTSSGSSEAWLKDWWTSNFELLSNKRIVAIHLGVGPSAQYRRWPIERFVHLATRLTSMNKNVTFLLTGGSSEQSLIEDFRCKFSGNSIDASGTGTLSNTAALLKRCDLLICGDTGIMHLAAAMGTPTVGLFGPNTPDCWAPVGPRATYVYPTVQPCSPCINSYRRQIPAKCTAAIDSACMWDITVQDVLQAAQNVAYGSWLELGFTAALHNLSYTPNA